jgi:hypothetical protein
LQQDMFESSPMASVLGHMAQACNAQWAGA